ncbi:MAG: NUDIX domain-containing protein, partial [Lentisphaeria bacterium]
YVIEFPAGLVDANEQVSAAALRELFEETGYRGEIKTITPPLYSSPGMTDEAISLALIEVDENTENNKNVEPHFDGEEEIETILVAKDQLEGILAGFSREGDGIDSKVISYLLGIKNV